VGVKEAMHGPYADDSFWFAESNYPDFDPEGAKVLIDEYVAEKGAVEFEFAGNQDPFLVSYQELFQAMWADIGVTANIVSRAQSENISAVLSGAHQVILWGGIGGGDPDKDYQYFHSGTGLNFSGYTSPTIDAAMEQGRALGDPEARKEQYAIVQQELGEQMPYIFTGTNRLSAIAAGNLLGIDAFTLPDGTPGQPVTGAIYYLKDAWLAQ
jgi:peptide/nickel transport system substrate-binding protein